MSETGTAGTATTPWHAGLDTDSVGYITNRGWDKLEAKDAALQALKSYREAEKMLGAPADKVVKLPKDASDVVGWQSVYSKLGVPADAKDYDFSSVKFADGSDINSDAEFAGDVRAIAKTLNLTKDQASAMAKELVSRMDSDTKSETLKREVFLAQERDKLKQNWGALYAQNKIISENAYKALGVTDEQWSAFEKTIGPAQAAQLFHEIGVRLGEDRFIRSGVGGNTGIMTKDSAQSRLTALQNDSKWRDKYFAGDAEAKKEFHDLTRMIAGQ